MNRRWQWFWILFPTAFIAVTQLHPARAGFGIGPIHIPTSTEDIKDTVQKEAIKQIARELGGGSPTQVELDARKHFPKVEIKDFHGQEIKIHNLADVFRFRQPGDYWFHFWGLCNRGSIHSPSQGIPTVLGRPGGKRFPIVSDLALYQTGKGIPPQQLQATIATIESGLPFSQWRPDVQEIARKTIPQYIPDLQGDTLDEFRGKYESLRSKSPVALPNLEGFLQQNMKESWGLYQEIQQQRKILTDQTIALEHVPERLVAQDGTPAQLPPYQGKKESEWGEIAPGVYGRAVVINGFAGNFGTPLNRFEIRITNKAHSVFTEIASAKGMDKGNARAVPKPVQPPSSIPANDNYPGGIPANDNSPTLKFPKGSPGTTLGESLFGKGLARSLSGAGQLWAAYDTGFEIGAYAMEQYLNSHPDALKWVSEAMNTYPEQAAQSLTISPATTEEEKCVDDKGNFIYPDNDGFSGTPERKTLQPGTRIDRYGYDAGNFVAPEGTPYPNRSLAPGSNKKPYSVFKVVKPVEVLSGITRPWCGEPGNGIQYKFNQSIEELLHDKVIERVVQ